MLKREESSIPFVTANNPLHIKKEKSEVNDKGIDFSFFSLHHFLFDSQSFDKLRMIAEFSALINGNSDKNVISLRIVANYLFK